MSGEPADMLDGVPADRLQTIVSSYTAVTERLRESHERLQSEVIRLREELADKNRELARSERLAALGQMAAGLAHEIRNPLGGILLYASMLEKELSGDGPRLKLVERISGGVRSLEDLLTDILAFAGENRPQVRRVNLGRVLEQVTEMLWARLKELRTRLQVEERTDRVELTADPRQLRSALLNLVLNAAEAAGRGGQVQVLASVDGRGNPKRDPSRLGTPAGDRVRVWVRDDGPGIPPESLDCIFNPFFTTKAGGTGLGLAIVHRVAEAHGGAVRARNRPEGGAEFVLELPAGRARKAERGTGNGERGRLRPSEFRVPSSERSPLRGAGVRG